MIEIGALILTTRYIGKLAIQKGLKPNTWKIYSIACWFVFEFIGLTAGVVLFYQPDSLPKMSFADLLPLMLLGLVCAFGGFLLVRSILQNKPNNTPDEDINRIGVDDLKP